MEKEKNSSIEWKKLFSYHMLSLLLSLINVNTCKWNKNSFRLSFPKIQIGHILAWIEHQQNVCSTCGLHTIQIKNLDVCKEV